MRRLILLVAIIATIALTGSRDLAAQSTADETLADSIVVVTTPIEPFVERNGDRADGFYIEIWEDVAHELDITWEEVWADSYTEMLDMLESGEADIAVAPLAPTAEREGRFDFTSAVVSSGPQLAAHDRTTTTRSLVRVLLGSGALRVLVIAAIGLVLLGHLIWLVERRHPDISDFDTSYPGGVFDGMWWAAVTVTTVGYGDMSPKSWRGRAVAIVAMLASLFLVGAFVSQVTSDLNESREELEVSSLSDLDGQEIGTVAGSSFEAFVIAEGAKVRSYESQQALFEAVDVGEIDVVVANPYALATIGSDFGLHPVGDVLYEEFETFGLRQDSPWREPVNKALADLQASGHVQRIIARWVE